MRKTLGISLLVLLLTGSASAGIMPNESPAPPPQHPAAATQGPTDAEQASIVPNGAADSLTQTVLELLAALSLIL